MDMIITSQYRGNEGFCSFCSGARGSSTGGGGGEFSGDGVSGEKDC